MCPSWSAWRPGPRPRTACGGPCISAPRWPTSRPSAGPKPLPAGSLLAGLKADPATVHAAWQTARNLLHVDLTRRPLTQGRCWEAVGAYGATVGRTDIMQAGYEQALRCYGTLHPAERLRAAQTYRQAVRGNAGLAGDVAMRVAELKVEAAPENGGLR